MQFFITYAPFNFHFVIKEFVLYFTFMRLIIYKNFKTFRGKVSLKTLGKLETNFSSLLQNPKMKLIWNYVLKSEYKIFHIKPYFCCLASPNAVFDSFGAITQFSPNNFPWWWWNKKWITYTYAFHFFNLIIVTQFNWF